MSVRQSIKRRMAVSQPRSLRAKSRREQIRAVVFALTPVQKFIVEYGKSLAETTAAYGKFRAQLDTIVTGESSGGDDPHHPPCVAVRSNGE